MNLMYLKRRVYRESVGESLPGGSGDLSNAVNAFSSLLGGEAPAESEAPKEEDPEAAAERLASEEAANQNSAEEGDDAAESVPDTVTFEVDGKPVTLTKAELAELHKGNMRQKDYTQKTMEAAETRKAADAEIQKTRAERDNYAKQLNAFALTQEAIITDAQKILTQDLLNSDPVEYLTQQRILQERQANLSNAQAELQRIGTEQQQEAQQAQQDFLKRQHQAMLDKLPDWKDPAKMKEGLGKIESFMEERGFVPQDGMTILDARILMLANDAMKYRDLMARAAKAGEKVAQIPAKVERPGVTTKPSPTDGRTAAMKNLKQTGSLDAAAAAFAQFMR